MTEVVLLNGPVGAGKTTTAAALSDALRRDGVPHAHVDLDAIRLLWPPPPGDPFQHEVELANLRDLARNFRAAGARRLVLAGVVEDPGETTRYRSALGTDALLVVRLSARPEVLRSRLMARHADDEVVRAWHLSRAVELSTSLAAAWPGGAVVDTSDRSPADVAAVVREAAGW